MLAKRFRRYAGVVALIGALILFIIATLAVNIYVNTSVLAVDSTGAARGHTLRQLLLQLGPRDQKLKDDLLQYVRVIRDGGDLVTVTGEAYAIPRASDQGIIRTVDSLEALYHEGAYDQIVSAYNSFISAYQHYSARRTNYFTAFQVVAALVIISGFLAVLFVLFFRLGRADEQLKITLAQDHSILETIKDGVFMIDDKFQVGSVQSASTMKIFNLTRPIEGNFLEFISPLVSENDLVNARDYIALLMEGRGHQDLLTGLNPLNELEFNWSKGGEKSQRKYLNFDFSKGKNGAEKRVLVSISDITKEVQLKRELDQANADKQEKFQVLMGSLAADSGDLNSFFESTFNVLQEINEILRDDEDQHGDNMQKLDAINKKVHKLKGGASAMGMTLIETSAHHLESKIEELKDTPGVDGKQILGLTVQLKQMICELEFLEQLTAKFDLDKGSEFSLLSQSSMSESSANSEIPEHELSKLQRLARDVAKRNGKSVNLDAYGFEKFQLNKNAAEEVEAICIQLIRNSIVHGIEDSETRRERNKSSVGQIILALRGKDELNLLLTVRDDGAGLNLKDIRARAVKKGLVTFVKAAELNASQIARFLFKPGFTTRDDLDIDAGRGYGLDVVKSAVSGMGGKIGVKSRKGLYCQISITLPRTLLQEPEDNG